jgi:tripartite-type tricarboxylate transporter receptor subunit TctC
LTVKTVPEFLVWAKANPLGANFGSPAAGSTPHFIGALLGKIIFALLLPSVGVPELSIV